MVLHLTSGPHCDWYQHSDRAIYLADVLDGSKGSPMTAGFARYEKAGEFNDWVMTYDEVLVITRGAFSVTHPGGTTTAAAGEAIFLPKGTTVRYAAAQDRTELMYVTFPHWMEAHGRSPHAGLLDAFHPAQPVHIHEQGPASPASLPSIRADAPS